MQLKGLKKNPRNPRKITDEKLQAMRSSLIKYGDLSGIVYNVKTKTLVGGHQRSDTGLSEGEIEIVERYPKPTTQGTVAIGWVTIAGEKHKYREVDVDEIREKEMNLAANKHGGEWDFSILPEWLNELDSHNVEMDVVGWDDKELENILAPIGYKEPISDLSLEDEAFHKITVKFKTKEDLDWLSNQINEVISKETKTILISKFDSL